MKSFCTDFSKKYTVILVVVLLLFIFSLELIVRGYFVNIQRSIPNLVSRVYFNKNPNVVIGDSHIYWGFINEKEYLNLGMQGMPIPVMQIVLNNYFESYMPGNVIIEASPQQFSRPHLSRNTMGFENYFKHKSMGLGLYSFEPGLTQYFAQIKSIKGFFRIFTITGEHDKNITSENWLSLTKKQRNNREKIRVKRHEPILNNPLSIRFKAQYEEIIKTLLDKNARVCMLRTPVNQGYKDLIIDNPKFQHAITYFDSIAKKYNVKFVNYLDLQMDFSEEVFINQDHITPASSVTFSRLVKEACFGTHSSW